MPPPSSLDLPTLLLHLKSSSTSPSPGIPMSLLQCFLCCPTAHCVSAFCSIHHRALSSMSPGIPTKGSLLISVGYRYYLGPESLHRAWHRAGIHAYSWSE